MIAFLTAHAFCVGAIVFGALWLLVIVYGACVASGCCAEREQQPEEERDWTRTVLP